jgi:hypothetical protein
MCRIISTQDDAREDGVHEQEIDDGYLRWILSHAFPHMGFSRFRRNDLVSYCQ